MRCIFQNEWAGNALYWIAYKLHRNAVLFLCDSHEGYSVNQDITFVAATIESKGLISENRRSLLPVRRTPQTINVFWNICKCWACVCKIIEDTAYKLVKWVAEKYRDEKLWVKGLPESTPTRHYIRGVKLNFIAGHFSIMIALKGPVVCVRLDVWSTPPPFHQMSPLEVKRPPFPPLQCTTLTLLCCWEKAGVVAVKSKVQGLKEDQKRAGALLQLQWATWNGLEVQIWPRGPCVWHMCITSWLGIVIGYPYLAYVSK